MNIVPNTPFFFIEELDTGSIITLDSNESKHAIKSLRLKKDDSVYLINGKGLICKAIIVDDDFKNTSLQIIEHENVKPQPYYLHLAVGITQHPDRFEWMVEKSVELGVSEITPIVTQRTEKKSIKIERLQKIAISALKQSHQPYLPTINPPTNFKDFVQKAHAEVKAIAVCSEVQTPLSTALKHKHTSYIFVIGPEGDFTIEETQVAQKNNFIPIHLGSSVLRTETSGVYIASTLRFFYNL